MDFRDAMIFLAAVIVVVAAGVVLGMALQRRQRQPSPHVQIERLRTYAELIAAMDGLRSADQEHKQRFILAYYRALVHAPDTVVRQLNAYLQAITLADSQYDGLAQSAARDTAVWAMRQDAQGLMDAATKLAPAELYSIEINTEPDTTIMKPASVVDTSEAIGSPASTDTQR